MIGMLLGLGGKAFRFWSGRPEYMPYVNSEGRVTLDGKPVDGATVYARLEYSGRLAMAETDNYGNFELRTLGWGKCVRQGRHFVIVVKFVPAASPLPETLEFETGVNVLPHRYADYDTSGLSFEAKQDVINVFNIELTSQSEAPELLKKKSCRACKKSCVS